MHGNPAFPDPPIQGWGQENLPSDEDAGGTTGGVCSACPSRFQNGGPRRADLDRSLLLDQICRRIPFGNAVNAVIRKLVRIPAGRRPSRAFGRRYRDPVALCVNGGQAGEELQRPGAVLGGGVNDTEGFAVASAVTPEAPQAPSRTFNTTASAATKVYEPWSRLLLWSAANWVPRSFAITDTCERDSPREARGCVGRSRSDDVGVRVIAEFHTMMGGNLNLQDLT